MGGCASRPKDLDLDKTPAPAPANAEPAETAAAVPQDKEVVVETESKEEPLVDLSEPELAPAPAPVEPPKEEQVAESKPVDEPEAPTVVVNEEKKEAEKSA